ncbi:hypothetical protein MKX03_028008 [Papaver bracteatum]|nr:hypothetical protein MKX03_028008 [Papaver bracteatum]
MAPIWPIFSKSKTNHKVLSSESIYETVNGSHEYKIKGFSLAKGIGVGKSISSRTFTVCGGDSQDDQEYVSVFLKIVSPGEVRATFEFKLLDQSEKGKHGVHKIYTVKSPITFTQGVAGSWYVSVFLWF